MNTTTTTTTTYRDYIRDLLACKFNDNSPTAMTRLLGGGLVVYNDGQGMNLTKIWGEAAQEFGASVGTFVEYCAATSAWYVVASRDSCTYFREPLHFRENKLLCKDKELVLMPGPIAFPVCTWIARTVFGLDGETFPLFHRITHESLGFRPSTQACYDSGSTPAQILKIMDLYVHDTAKYTRDFDPMEASIVDILHCFGVLYVGSVNEATSKSEKTFIDAALDAGAQDKLTHLWWLEDHTLFEDNRYILVVRYNIAGNPYYMKRPLSLTKNREQLKDVASKTVSNRMNFDYTECGILQFNQWVQTFLGIPHAKAWPYMRREIVERYRGLISINMMRPFLVNGKVAQMPMDRDTLAPRLTYSPDLFVERRKIPKGTNPSTVHFWVTVKPKAIDVEDVDMRMFLRVGDDGKNAYRVLFTKDGQMFPEEDQLRVFVQSENQDMLGDDAIQLVVLRRHLGPCGAIVVEFVFTSHWKPFRLYTDTKQCDYEARFTLFDYYGNVTVFPTVNLPVYTSQVQLLQNMHNISNEKAVQTICQEKTKRLVPLVYVESMEGTYEFQYFDGQALVSVQN